VFTLFDHPKHPYTKGLMQSIPDINDETGHRLASIEGTVPTPQHMPNGCRFHTRCPFATEQCIQVKPSLLTVDLKLNHKVRCFLYENEQPSSKEGEG
jgi:peptide/nickel transport system ATP-binding protein